MESREPSTRRALRWIVPVAVVALAQLAATCRPPPDLDGEPSLARPLELDRWQDDTLHCGKHDCADWYLVRVRSTGTLQADVAPVTPAPGSLRVAIADHRAKTLQQTEASSDSGATLRQPVEPGAYFVKVEAPEGSEQVAYRVRAMLEVPKPPPPPPPPPTTRLLRSEILEVEGAAGRPQFVLFGSGQRDGLRPGMRGNLVQDGEILAPVEVREVFPDGTRARLLATPSRPITPSATVEIEIEVDEPDAAAPSDS